jgi:hypothetical protein
MVSLLICKGSTGVGNRNFQDAFGVFASLTQQALKVDARNAAMQVALCIKDIYSEETTGCILRKLKMAVC